MPWQDGLLDDQRRAAAHAGTHARLLAGPGTGKTLTLTRHLLKLVLQDRVSPEEILAVAFTRINAYDFSRSVADEFARHKLLPPRISTLHSFALSQLLRNAGLIRTLPQPLRIADDFEEDRIIRPDLADVLGISDRQVRKKFSDLSADWQDLRLDAAHQKPADPRFMGAWLQHRAIFGYTLRSELVWQLKYAMEENPLEFNMGATIHHLLVDEYQDLNKCDLAVIAAMASRGAEVYAAGDDDQSIYSFRGAYPEGIRRFTKEFHPAASLELEVCWRSDREIISLGQYVAGLDPKRLPKPIRPRDDADAGEVHLLQFSDQFREADGIAAICQHLIRARGYLPDNILILLRSDHQGRYSAPIRAALQSAAIPVTVRAERGGPLDEGPGRHLLALLRLSQNEQDDLAWRTLLHIVRPGNQIGDVTIRQLYEHAQENRLRFSQVLREVELSPATFARSSYIISELQAIRALVAPMAQLPVPIPDRLSDPNYRTAVQGDLVSQVHALTASIVTSPDDLNPIMDVIVKATQRWNATTPAELVNALTSPEDTLDQELDAGKVNLLSMHRAKGLSSNAVIVVGTEEELIPGNAAGEAYNDERRLLYVSLTRAKHILIATYCNKRTGWQSHSGSRSGNPRRHLTAFLRGALASENGEEFAQSLM